MTRFARAKGSKASNERTPEDSTPWEVMKEQIVKSKQESEEAKHRKEAEQQRIENYNNFLKEQKVQKRKATWCDFPENKPVTNFANESNAAILKKKKKNQENTSKNEQVNGNKEPTESVSEFTTKPKKKKKKNKLPNNQKEADDNKDDIQTENVVEPTEKCNNTAEEASNNKLKKKNKKKNKKSNQTSNNKEENKDFTEKEEDKIKENNQEVNNKKVAQNASPEKNLNKINNMKKLKKKNNTEPVRRKEINDRSFQLIVNGKEIELVRYDGFPVMKKDAERLEELKKSMIKKGIPKTEVQRTMKLERRRAEKALARVKREVCYNCRKGGHNLSDCPDLKSKIPGVDSAEGVCFKCGSTEHRQFECKVQRDKEFRFATCFICKEAGHIARQCPDNPKGLYPNGGCCKLCGDVTHLKKDCPTTNSKKEETSIKLQTLDSTDNLEDINQKVGNTFKEEGNKKPKKIKF